MLTFVTLKLRVQPQLKPGISLEKLISWSIMQASQVVIVVGGGGRGVVLV